MVRRYAGTIRPGTVYENLALKAARQTVLKFYRYNARIFRKGMRRAKPKINLASLNRMTVKQLNRFISEHLSKWRNLSKQFKDHYRASLNRDDPMYDRMRGSITSSLRRNQLNIWQAGYVWETVFSLRAGSVGGPRMPQTPPLREPRRKPPTRFATRSAPRPIVRVNPRLNTAEKQQALKKDLFAAVRRVYGPATPDKQVMIALKYCGNNEEWKNLIQLRVVHFIRQAFAKHGYRRAASSLREARIFLSKLLQNWERGSTRVIHRPAPAPKKPVVAAAPRVTLVQRKKMILAALFVVLKAVKLADTLTDAAAFALGQSWKVVKTLKLHKPFIVALKSNNNLAKLFPSQMSKARQIRVAQQLFILLKSKK